MSIIAYYLLEGYPPNVLLPLVISDIIYGPKDRPQRINGSANFAVFRDALNELLAIGLTAEPLDEPIAESPALTEADAKAPKLLASLAAGAAAGNTTLDLKRYKVVNPTDPANKDPNLLPSEYNELKSKNSIYFRLEKKNTKYRFCLDSVKLDVSLRVFNKQLPTSIHLRPELPEIVIDKANLCGAKPQGEPDKNLKVSENMAFQTRSVEGIIFFLGEIVQSKVPLTISNSPEGGGTTVIFTASEQTPAGPSISAAVDGRTYYVNVDATDVDKSSRVLQLLSELIALNNSAKDLPAPNVITVISP